MKEKAIVIPGSFSLLTAYSGYRGIDIWLKSADKSVGECEWVIAHSAGAAYFLTRPELHGKKVIFINPLVKKRSWFSLFVRDIKFFIYEGIGKNIIPYSSYPYAAIQVLKLLKVNVLEGVRKLPKENVFIIRGTKDYYFCDSEDVELIKKEGFNLYEVEAAHNWNENIAKKVGEIISLRDQGGWVRRGGEVAEVAK
jgi:hypothetical protein